MTEGATDADPKVTTSTHNNHYQTTKTLNQSTSQHGNVNTDGPLPVKSHQESHARSYRKIHKIPFDNRRLVRKNLPWISAGSNEQHMLHDFLHITELFRYAPCKVVFMIGLWSKRIWCFRINFFKQTGRLVRLTADIQELCKIEARFKIRVAYRIGPPEVALDQVVVASTRLEMMSSDLRMHGLVIRVGCQCTPKHVHSTICKVTRSVDTRHSYCSP
jgi:hypothetical protein